MSSSLLTSIRAHDDFDSHPVSVFDHGRKMEHQAPTNPPAQPQPQPHPQPHSLLPPPLPQNPSLTTSNTPVSSPGLFSPSNPRTTMSLPPSQSVSEGTTPAALNSPFLHPLQNHRVREYVYTVYQASHSCNLSLSLSHAAVNVERPETVPAGAAWLTALMSALAAALTRPAALRVLVWVVGREQSH